jgi:hypothetical protein
VIWLHVGCTPTPNGGGIPLLGSAEKLKGHVQNLLNPDPNNACAVSQVMVAE